MNIKSSEFLGRRIRPVELALLIKWLLRIKRTPYTLPDRNKFYVDPISDFGLKLMKYNSYEADMTSQITKMLKEGDVFVDLGGNEGYFSILGSRIVGKTGFVITIEPQQRLWEVIIKNVEINSLANVLLLPYGIGSEPGEAVMNLYPTLNSGASSLAKSFNFKVSLRKLRRSAYNSSIISIRTLDELLLPFARKIKLIKIDIEGFEFEALKGARQILEGGYLENLLIEIHPNALHSMGQSEQGIDELLSKYGYRKKEVAENLLLYSK